MDRGRPMGEPFDHRPAGWIRQSRKCCTQYIHNLMVVDFSAVSSTNFCDLYSAKSRCDLTQQFLRANMHGAARREYLALVSGNWLATHADGCLGAAAACCRNPECLAPSSHEVVPDCSGQPTPS